MKTTFEPRDFAVGPQRDKPRCQRRRREIFVAVKSKRYPSSIGATSLVMGWNLPRLRRFGGGTLPLFSPLVQSASGLAQSKTWRMLVATFLLVSAFSLPLSAFSQSYAIDWHKIAGGGGTSTNGQYVVSGTIGQPDATVQTLSGGNYSLTGGFWALIQVVQTPGAPTLYISRSGGTVTVSWQAVPGWSLQQNDSLSAPANWTASGYPVTIANATNSITIPAVQGNLFFRLQSSP